MDKTTKFLLAAIALGLFANAIPRAQAQGIDPMVSIAMSLRAIADGSCENGALCKRY